MDSCGQGVCHTYYLFVIAYLATGNSVHRVGCDVIIGNYVNDYFYLRFSRCHMFDSRSNYLKRSKTCVVVHPSSGHGSDNVDRTCLALTIAQCCTRVKSASVPIYLIVLIRGPTGHLGPNAP